MGPPRLASPLRSGGARWGRAAAAPRGDGDAPLSALRPRVPAAGRAQPARRSGAPRLTTMAGRRTPPPMGPSPESANPGRAGGAPEPCKSGRRSPRSQRSAGACCVQRRVRGGSAGPCGAAPLRTAGARGREMSQSPPGPQPAPAPARWLPSAARHCAHMDASRGSAPLPRPGSGRAALHFCLHSSSSSFPPLPTPLAEKGGRGRQSGHEKKHQAGEQGKKRQRNKIKINLKKIGRAHV